MRRADKITGIIMLIFGVAVMEGGRRMPPSNTFGPGAGFLPFWLGVAMALLALLLFVNAVREKSDAADRSPFPDTSALVSIGLTVVSLAVYNLLIEPLGFLISTVLLSGFLLRVVEGERWPATTLVAVGNAIGLYIIFQVLLGVGLPKNALGF
jgi:putative tricarboxylic transport membrane protein